MAVAEGQSVHVEFNGEWRKGVYVKPLTNTTDDAHIVSLSGLDFQVSGHQIAEIRTASTKSDPHAVFTSNSDMVEGAQWGAE